MTQPLMQTVEAVRFQLQSFVRPITETEMVPLLHALGRIQAEDVVSVIQVPPHDNSAMDGYALCVEDGSECLPVSQRIPAGSVAHALLPGTVARIFTGATIPAGANAVVEQEAVEIDPQGRVNICRSLQPGLHIRKAGEDIDLGQVIIPASKILNAADLGLAASLGLTHLKVLRRLRVSVFFTGDELIEPGEVLSEGKIYNSNRYWLMAKLQSLGCEIQDLGIVPDDFQATCLTVRRAAVNSDVVITCGGVSVGEEDHVKAAVQQEGTLTLWKVAMKPGKPLAYGRLGAGDFIGLPGNPVSGFVVFEVLIRSFLTARSGAEAQWTPPVMPLPSAFIWTKTDPKREEYLRVRREQIGGVWQLTLYPNQGSGVLTSCAWAEGLVKLKAGQTVKKGDLLNFIHLEH